MDPTHCDVCEMPLDEDGVCWKCRYDELYSGAEGRQSDFESQLRRKDQTINDKDNEIYYLEQDKRKLEEENRRLRSENDRLSSELNEARYRYR